MNGWIGVEHVLVIRSCLTTKFAIVILNQFPKRFVTSYPINIVCWLTSNFNDKFLTLWYGPDSTVTFSTIVVIDLSFWATAWIIWEVKFTNAKVGKSIRYCLLRKTIYFMTVRISHRSIIYQKNRLEIFWKNFRETGLRNLNLSYISSSFLNG